MGRMGRMGRLEKESIMDSNGNELLKDVMSDLKTMEREGKVKITASTREKLKKLVRWSMLHSLDRETSLLELSKILKNRLCGRDYDIDTSREEGAYCEH